MEPEQVQKMIDAAIAAERGRIQGQLVAMRSMLDRFDRKAVTAADLWDLVDDLDTIFC